MATIPLTRKGADKLKEELHRLKSVERHAVIQAIAEARAQGDLSENAEYDAAKDKQGFIEGRILELEAKLAAAQVIDPSTLDADGRVVFGATVDLEDQDSGTTVTYQIVGDDEADLKLGLVCVSSPVARALIGKQEGDRGRGACPRRRAHLRDRRRALHREAGCGRRAPRSARPGTAAASPRAVTPPMRDPVRWSALLAAGWLGMLLAVAAIGTPAAFALLPAGQAGPGGGAHARHGSGREPGPRGGAGAAAACARPARGAAA
jgi:transcription elongation factor GreA